MTSVWGVGVRLRGSRLTPGLSPCGRGENGNDNLTPDPSPGRRGGNVKQPLTAPFFVFLVPLPGPDVASPPAPLPAGEGGTSNGP